MRLTMSKNPSPPKAARRDPEAPLPPYGHTAASPSNHEMLQHSRSLHRVHDTSARVGGNDHTDASRSVWEVLASDVILWGELGHISPGWTRFIPRPPHPPFQRGNPNIYKKNCSLEEAPEGGMRSIPAG